MKRLKSLALIVLLFPFLLAAQDHVAIGSRPMSPEAWAQVQATKPQEIFSESDPEVQIASLIFDRYPPVYYSSTYHRIAAVTVLDTGHFTLELEDGSVWKVNGYDGKKILEWRANDPITFSQNNRWFAKHAYRIINKIDGASVEADLFLGPIERGHYSRFIRSIDSNKREVVLSDNTSWELSSLDSSIFKDWAPNDYILIGSNSITSFWDSTSNILLINVNLNNTARAKQF